MKPNTKTILESFGVLIVVLIALLAFWFLWILPDYFVMPRSPGATRASVEDCQCLYHQAP